MAAQFARAPHVGRPTGPIQQAPNAALLIDFDNVTMGIRSDLSKELKSLLNSDIIKGKVAVQRAYADWRRYPQYIVPLAEASVDLIFAPAYGSSKKNATDIRLAIDALELVFTRPEIGTFILLSGDSDFSSLVLKLKEYGKYVIGVGIRESASDLLVQNCDEYYSYSVLSGLTREGEDTIERQDPWSLVEQAVRQMAERRDIMRSDRLKQVMVELDPTFSEKDIGYSKFSKFLQDAVERGRLRLIKGENGQWEVMPPNGAAPAAERAAEPEAAPRPEGRRGRERDREERRRGRGREAAEPTAEPRGREVVEPLPKVREPEVVAAPAEAGPAVQAATGDLRAAYTLLRRSVEELVGRSGGAARDSDVKRRMLELEPGWDEASLGFSKFSRFLRQAHDGEVIDLRKLENGAYEVAPSGAREREWKIAPERHAALPAEAVSQTRAVERPRREPAAEVAAQPAPVVEPEIVALPTAEAKAVEPKQERTPVREAAPVPKPETRPEPAARAQEAARLPVAGLGFRRGTRGRGELMGPPPILPGQTVGAPEATNGDRAPKPAAQPKAAPRRGADRIAEPSVPAAVPQPEVAAAAGVVAQPVAEPSVAEPSVTEPEVAEQSAAEERPSRARRSRGRGRKRAAEAVPTQTLAVTFGLPADRDGVVEYLSRRYKGVGKKTAEALIDTFGADNVFEALHSQADRVREVLGGRRADTVLEGWQADLSQRQGQAAAPAGAPAPEAAAAAEAAAPVADAAEPAEAGPGAEDEGAEAQGGANRRSRGRRGGRRGGRKRKAKAPNAAGGEE